MTNLGKSTLEDVFYTLSIFTAIVGAIFWLTTMYSQSQANTDDIKVIKTSQAGQASQFEEIRIRLVRIEDAVGAHK